MKGIDVGSPIPECIICKETELESSTKLISNVLCDCFYNYHKKCMEIWLKNKEKRCILCSKLIDFEMPQTTLDLVRIEVNRARERRREREGILKAFIIVISIILICTILGLIIYVMSRRGFTL